MIMGNRRNPLSVRAFEKKKALTRGAESLRLLTVRVLVQRV